jgi:hypothetical protein
MRSSSSAFSSRIFKLNGNNVRRSRNFRGFDSASSKTKLLVRLDKNIRNLTNLARSSLEYFFQDPTGACQRHLARLLRFFNLISRSSFSTRCNFRFIQLSDSDLDVFSSTKWLARFYQLSYFHWNLARLLCWCLWQSLFFLRNQA